MPTLQIPQEPVFNSIVNDRRIRFVKNLRNSIYGRGKGKISMDYAEELANLVPQDYSDTVSPASVIEVNQIADFTFQCHSVAAVEFASGESELAKKWIKNQIAGIFVP